MKLITIITVCYNSEKTIKRTINSILSSEEIDFSEIEYIIIDGESSDKTIDILKDSEEEMKAKGITYRWYSEKDTGIYNAMNKGIDYSRGEYIAFLNSDDYYRKDTLEIVLQEMKKTKKDAYYGSLEYIKNGQEISTVNYHINNISKKMINHPTCFIKKEIYLELNKFDEKYKYSSDYDFILRSVKLKKEFVNIKKLTVCFTLDNNASEKTAARIETLNLKYANKFLSEYDYLLYKIIYFFRRILRRI